jgi:FtsP/CotA-like multicopper oxidase with cupredoxin domain
LTVTPAIITSDFFTFTAPVYHNNITNQVYLFGPTIRIRPRQSFRINLINNLTYGVDSSAQEEETESPSGNIFTGVFEDPLGTNLHTHGLHDRGGPLIQNATAPYDGGDDVFINVPAQSSQQLSFEPLHVTHLPGLHWYHPHRHMSTYMQTVTLLGLMSVEGPLGDQVWLPRNNGCGPFADLLDVQDDEENVPEVMMIFRVIPFKSVQELFADEDAVKQEQEILNNPSYQEVNERADPLNPYCCDEVGLTTTDAGDGNSTTSGSGNSSSGSGSGSNATAGDADPINLITGPRSDGNTILVNQGIRPIIRMKAGKYQRWRLLHSGPKFWWNLMIKDDETLEDVTDQCEFLLYAKDGIYLQEVPRKLNFLIMIPGGRSESLVRCSKPGNYTLYAGETNNAAYPITVPQSPQIVVDVVATLEVTDSKGEAVHVMPPLEECIPLRPTYAPDLRDASITAANAWDKVVYDNATFNFDPAQGYGCTINNQNFTYPDNDPIVMKLGSIMEWNKYGALNFHPMHIHVNPFMISDLNETYLAPNMTYTDYFKVGDYHDTIMLPMQAQGAIAKVRFQPGPFACYSVMHCHILQHEDMGCMKVVKFECPGYGGVNTEQPAMCAFEPPINGTFSEKSFDFEGGNSTDDGNDGRPSGGVGRNEGKMGSGVTLMAMVVVWGWIL